MLCLTSYGIKTPVSSVGLFFLLFCFPVRGAAGFHFPFFFLQPRQWKMYLKNQTENPLYSHNPKSWDSAPFQPCLLTFPQCRMHSSTEKDENSERLNKWRFGDSYVMNTSQPALHGDLTTPACFMSKAERLRSLLLLCGSNVSSAKLLCFVNPSVSRDNCLLLFSARKKINMPLTYPLWLSSQTLLLCYYMQKVYLLQAERALFSAWMRKMPQHYGPV